MERTTVYLDSDLKRRLRAAAAQRATTEASIIRAALTGYLASDTRPELRTIAHSTDGGIAHRVDEALADLGFGER